MSRRPPPPLEVSEGPPLLTSSWQHQHVYHNVSDWHHHPGTEEVRPVRKEGQSGITHVK